MRAIDPDIAEQLEAALEPDDFVRILSAFEADLGRLAQEFDQAVAADDADGHRRAAHSLAGTAAGIGARRLEAVARQALDAVPEEPPHRLADLIRRETAAARAELALLRLRPDGQAT
ncbi:Hpt domain-containing protein [Falsiroseomonas oryzae]|uniref:Hpt domain-containing protein n=1 Tax=Falsiroseomonas oryzae TaxID=2766473 RepID=UPI0022EAE748|nr:Hpt domain-containing protein [Roseomonas sp. MO-31]